MMDTNSIIEGTVKFRDGKKVSVHLIYSFQRVFFFFFSFFQYKLGLNIRNPLKNVFYCLQIELSAHTFQLI